MKDFNPNTRLEKNADKFELPVNKLAILYRSSVVILADGTKIRGLDLSHWQEDENIDFVTLKANDIDFVILKVTEGVSFVDDTFKSKYEKALAAGQIVMPYHFFRGNYGGVAQARHCINTLRELGFLDAIDYVPIIWFDVESSDGVSVSARRNRLLNALQETEVKGFQAGVYSSPYYWNWLIGFVTWIQNYFQWDAHWTSASLPTLPMGWSREKALFWQNGIYPAHSWVETVVGAKGNVDHNYFFGTLEDLKQLLKFPVSPPPTDCNCEKEIARLDAEINFLKLEVYNLQQKDIALTKEVDGLGDYVYNNTLRVTQVENNLNELADTTYAWHTSVIRNLDSLSDRVSELESLVLKIENIFRK